MIMETDEESRGWSGAEGWRVARNNGVSKKRFLSRFSEAKRDGRLFSGHRATAESLLSEKTVIIQIDDAAGNRIFG